MNKIQRRIARLRENGQVVHCPDCGVGYPVTDPGTADCLERMVRALEMIATGKGTGCTEAENASVMRQIAKEGLANEG